MAAQARRAATPAVDKLFFALGDPTRRQMVERLSASPASVSDLAQPSRLSLPAVLQHLRLLETSGLVRSEKIGRVRTYRIEPKAFAPMRDWLSERQTMWQRRFDRLGMLLDEDEGK